jgi:hypothetical protein
MSDALNVTIKSDATSLSSQEPITLAQAARLLPRIKGRKVWQGTLWRWARVGLRGERLPYMRMGRKICTSRQALTEFFTRLAARDRKNPPPVPSFVKRKPISSKRRERALREADKVLARAGI